MHYFTQIKKIFSGLPALQICHQGAIEHETACKEWACLPWGRGVTRVLTPDQQNAVSPWVRTEKNSVKSDNNGVYLCTVIRQ